MQQLRKWEVQVQDERAKAQDAKAQDAEPRTPKFRTPKFRTQEHRAQKHWMHEGRCGLDRECRLINNVNLEVTGTERFSEAQSLHQGTEACDNKVIDPKSLSRGF